MRRFGSVFRLEMSNIVYGIDIRVCATRPGYLDFLSAKR